VETQLYSVSCQLKAENTPWEIIASLDEDSASLIRVRLMLLEDEGRIRNWSVWPLENQIVSSQEALELVAGLDRVARNVDSGDHDVHEA
jgi:hypothetical protein